MERKSYIPNQVFIGCPWKTIKPKYESAVDSLKKEYPLAFVIIGREVTQDAHDLFDRIKSKLLSSSYAIFDATGGNANVSLEYGLSEGSEVPRALYICDHKTAKKDLKDHPIISDLAGKKRNIYKTEAGLRKLLKQFCENHDYTKRFDKFLKKYWSGKTLGQKKRIKALYLKILHVLDEKDKVRRNDLVSSMLGLNYKENEIEDAIKALHQSKFIIASMGRYSDISIREK